MKCLFVVLVFFCVSTSGWAKCVEADRIAHTKDMLTAISTYESCAIQYNDDVSQALLAPIYEEGRYGVARNLQRALLFYHLSAENGNAVSQTALAELLMRLDENEEGRAEIRKYIRKINVAGKTTGGRVSADILHPYALLALAAEKQAAKWYYPSDVLSSPKAAHLFRSYQIEPDKQKEVMRLATAWKNRKLLAAAKEVLSADEYQRFYDELYPAVGRPDAFSRSQTLQRLEEQMKIYRTKAER